MKIVCIAGFVFIAAATTLPSAALAGDGAAEAAADAAPAAGAVPNGSGTNAGSDALQGGGPANPGKHSPRGSLQDALKECEGLTGSASAKCQERALYAHPGQED